MLKKIMSHSKTHAVSVPYTVASRKASIKKLYALAQYFNMPSVFITFSPDDTNGVLNLRLAIPSTDNIVFPANGEGFMEAIRGRNPIFRNININPSALKGFLASNPIAAAEIFNLLPNAVFSHPFGNSTRGKDS